MLPSQRDTAPAMPALDVKTQCAQRPSELVCAIPVRVCRARTKNRRARSIGDSPGSGVFAFTSSSREKGVRLISLISSAPWSRRHRKKLTTSESRSLYVSTGAGGRLMSTAAEPPKGSQK